MPALDTIPPETFSPAIQQTVSDAPLPGLDAEPQCQATCQKIESLVAQQDVPPLVAAGLWLLAGELDRSHTISQSEKSPEGSFWHGIMHRREGDFWNSKYWFRQVGKHPVHTLLAERIASERASFAASGLPLDGLIDARRLPSQLVDLVEAALGGKSQWRADLERICWWEWQFLLAASRSTH